LTTAEQVTEKTGAGDVCGGCIDEIEWIIKEINTK
jgi:bacterioferritin-associated ferredoxin